MKIIKWGGTLLLILLLLTFFACYQYVTTPYKSESVEQKQSFVLVRGAKPSEVVKSLEDSGLIDHPQLFLWYGRFIRLWGKLKAAEYDLSPSMSPMQIAKILQSGIGRHRELLIREGENIYQISDALEQAEFGPKDQMLKLLKSRELIELLGLSREGLRSLEGYLLPNTYYYDRKDQAVTVIRRMVDAFLKLWTPEMDDRARELNFTRYEVVTLASVVEKETGVGRERPIISSVFHNRLKKKMRLQSDPTTIYGMWERYDGNIRKDDLRAPTEYNTYTVPGLPAGPIANPHIDSIKAVLYPENTEYLYFVSKNDGTHQFSKTYEEHNHWVNILQRDRRSREGKSWRDLNKP